MSDESAAADTITVVHVPEKHRYELRDGDAVPGFAQYVLPDDEHVDFTHTQVSEEYGGRGLAGRLISFALADTSASGKRIIPHCPFVAAWLRKHPGEYDELTDWPED
jgi:predicted GNAT family acetyltransferase